MKYKNIVLLSDLDGTLLQDDKRLSQENIDAINYFISQGGKFGVATGRNHHNALEFIQEVSTNIPSIFCNGGVVYDINSENLIKYNTIEPKSIVGFLKHIIKELPYIMIMVYTADYAYTVSNKKNVNQLILDQHEPYEFKPVEDILEKAWIKILFCGREDELKTIETEAKKFDLSKHVAFVNSGDIYFEFVPNNISKGTMLNELREMIGKDHKYYAVGDYYNDLEMIEQADTGIAVDNAVDDVKEASDYISTNNNDSAIADVIYNIINKTL
ncbi:MAG TPA: HAD family hydrolase [Clostridiales bacterium]|nr:HAD family hydrolase [Clostridiales bacterium]